MSRLCASVVLSFLSVVVAYGQVTDLRKEVAAIAATVKGKVGVALIGPGGAADTVTLSGASNFPMQSVYKFALGMFILDQVDKGKLALSQHIHVTKAELRTGTWSPMREKYPEGNVDLTLGEILTYTVEDSDNNGCDILFKLGGGPEKVNDFVHAIGVNNIAVKTTEEEMHRDWKAQYTNYSTPVAMAQLLGIFLQGKLLSKSSNDFLWKMMVETTRGDEKIKALLPAGSVVAHKSGASDVNDKGMIAAANDVGIVTLPNGRYLTIVVFISDTMDSAPQCATAIAKIARAAWDHYAFVR